MSSGYPPYGGMQGPVCQRCRTPLQPNEANCRNCGYYNAPVQGSNPVSQAPSGSNAAWGNYAPPQGQGQGSYGPPSWGQFPVSPPAPNLTASPQAPGNFANPSASPLQPNAFGASMTPLPPMSTTNYLSDQAVPPGFAPSQPPFAVPQRPSTGPVGPQSFAAPPSGPISHYGVPPAGFQPYGPPSSPGQPYGPPSSPGQPYGTPPALGQQYPGGMPFEAARRQSGELQPFAQSSSSADFPGFAQPAFKEKATPRRRKRSVIIILLVVLIIVAGFTSYAFIKHNGSSNVKSTPTLVTGVPKLVPLFTDTFKNNANGWDLQADPGKFSVSISGGALALEDNNNELLWELLPGNKTYGDFSVSVDAVLSQGDQMNGYGIYIRGSAIQNSEMATYYRFELYGDSSYAVFKGTMDANGTLASAKLVDYTLSPAIQKQGTLNHIMVTARGSAMQLSVNGQVIKTLADSSYANGSIAFFVSNLQNAKPGAQVKFSNLKINPA